MFICPAPKKGTKSKGFTLIELIVVIAIMAVLVAVLAPALLRYVEDSRMQRDESATGEVAHAVHLAMADPETYDAVYGYSIPNNYTTYTDSSAVYGAKYEDDQFWAPDGYGRTVTITFNPDTNGNYDIAQGVVNNMTNGNGSVSDSRALDTSKQCTLQEMGNQELYAALKSSIGPTLEEASATYKNSSYTVFIKFDTVGTSRRVEVYGEFNGTNLSPDSTVSQSSGNSVAPPEKPDAPVVPEATQPKPNTPSQSQPSTPPADLGGTGGTSSNPPPHVHNYTTVTTPATCTTAGLETNTCSCGDSTTTTQPALGHVETTIPGTPATCTTAGKTESRKCQRCGEVLQESTTIPALNHDYTEKVTAPNCETPGTKVYTCKRDASHTYTESISATGHTLVEYGAVTPTCETDGYLPGQKCSKCNKVLQAPTKEPAYGHTTQTIKGTEATCTTSGRSDTVKCVKCGKTLSASTTIPAKGHSYVTQTTVSPTCTNPGRQVETCSACSEQQISVIPALNHIDTNNDNRCDRNSCGVLLVEIPGIGNVETDEPDLNVTYDEDEGLVKAETPPVQEEEAPELPPEVKPELITFNYGYVESNTEYTPGTYETVEYEETTIVTKYPVSRWRINWSYWEVDENEEITRALPPTVESINQCYGQYAVYNKETGETRTIDGITADAIILYAALSPAEDTLENMIYMAAYWNQTEGTNNNHIAVWNGSNYVEENHDAEIAAITEFTTTKTVKKAKQVEITAPSTTTNKVFVPAGTLQAEKGMTWESWLASPYNTMTNLDFKIVTEAFDEVPLTNVIQSNRSYGFECEHYQLQGVWVFNEHLDLSGVYDLNNDGEIVQSILFESNYQDINDDLYRDSHGEMVAIVGDVYGYQELMYDGYTQYTDDAWSNNAERKVDFGENLQTVSKEFYLWFTANAQCVEEVNEMHLGFIHFTDMTEPYYTFEYIDGMTWAQFVESSYNVIEGTSNPLVTLDTAGNVIFLPEMLDCPPPTGTPVKATDRITYPANYVHAHDSKQVFVWDTGDICGFMDEHYSAIETYHGLLYCPRCAQHYTWDKVPEGGIYTRYNGLRKEWDADDFEYDIRYDNTTTYDVDSVFPTPQPGDTFRYGDYEYCYGYVPCCPDTPSIFCYYDETLPEHQINGWTAMYKANDVVPEPMLAYIGESPVVSARMAYYGYSDIAMEIAPYIPDTVVDMNCAYGLNANLTTITNWPTNVENVSDSLHCCDSLQIVPAIPNSVTNMDYMFVGSDMTDIIITIDANPTSYVGCFENVDFETQKITLRGASTMLDAIGLTGQNYCTNCDGWCQESIDTVPDVPKGSSIPSDIIPEGGILYAGVTSTALGKYTGVTKIYKAGEAFPVLKKGDVFVYGEYEYKYEWYYDGDKWDTSTATEGWGVRVRNNTKSSYSDMLSIIGGQTVQEIGAAYSDCRNLIIAPRIPDSATYMYATFMDCVSLTQAPVIPSKVTLLSSCFKGCTSLTEAPIIPNKVYTLWGAFEGCTSLTTVNAVPAGVTSIHEAFENCTALTGTININATKPSVYSSCFQNVNFETQRLTLVGDNNVIDTLGATGSNYCANCNGYCYENEIALEAGTYRWNTTPTVYSTNKSWSEDMIFSAGGYDYNYISVSYEYDYNDYGLVLNNVQDEPTGYIGWEHFINDNPVIVISTTQMVSTDFYDWFITNAQPEKN